MFHLMVGTTKSVLDTSNHNADTCKGDMMLSLGDQTLSTITDLSRFENFWKHCDNIGTQDILMLKIFILYL